MSNNNDKSLKKLDTQIAKLSKDKKSNDKTPVIKKNDLVRKVKAKKIDEKIEQNKKNSKKKKTSNNAKTSIKNNVQIKDFNNIVDEKITTFSSKLSSDEIKELEDKLREIYDKEIITREHPNKDFFSNDFLNHLNEKISKVSDKVSNKANKLSRDFVEKIEVLSETPVDTKNEKLKRFDVLTIITIFLTVVFVICLVSFLGFLIWICTY